MLQPDDYYQLIQENKSQEIVQLFGSNPVQINTPLEGEITSESEVQMMAIRFKRIIDDYQATFSVVNTVEDTQFLAAELLIKGPEFELPLGTVFEYAYDQENEEVLDELVSIREYHSTYPLYQSHRVRDPILKSGMEIDLPEPVEKYMEALEEGNANEIPHLYTEDAYFRQPSGSEYKTEGREDLSKLYQELLSDGGITLQHCSVINNGETVAVEFNAIKWGKTMLKPQAGIAFYDYSSGKITAARVYDDVEPPL